MAKKETKMIQVELTTTDGAKMTTWVEKNKLLGEGSAVRLEGETEWRRVSKIYDGIELTKVEIESNRSWDNNNYDKHNTTSMKDRLK
jgi:hypothetical protein